MNLNRKVIFLQILVPLEIFLKYCIIIKKNPNVPINSQSTDEFELMYYVKRFYFLDLGNGHQNYSFYFSE